MKQFRPLFLLVFVVFLASCKKDKDPVPVTQSSLLSVKPWKRTALTVNPRLPADSTGNLLPADLFSYLQSNGSCINDNLKNFSPNNTFTFEQGATKCDPVEDQVYVIGTWKFSSDEKTLVLSPSYTSPLTLSAFEDFDLYKGNFNGAPLQTNFTILQLDATTLQYSYTYILVGQSSFQSYTFTETFTHQ